MLLIGAGLTTSSEASIASGHLDGQKRYTIGYADKLSEQIARKLVGEGVVNPEQYAAVNWEASVADLAARETQSFFSPAMAVGQPVSAYSANLARKLTAARPTDMVSL